MESVHFYSFFVKEFISIKNKISNNFLEESDENSVPLDGNLFLKPDFLSAFIQLLISTVLFAALLGPD